MQKLLFLAVLLLVPISFAYNVEMNFRYKISTSDEIYAGGLKQNADSTLTNLEKKYIVSQTAGTVAGLVFAGSSMNSLTLKTGSDYTFSINQVEDNNRLLIVLTNGTYSTIASKYESVGALLSTSFGYPILKSINFPILLQLQYDNIDIINSFFWQGQKTLQITNEGRVGGITKISIKQVR